MDSKNIKFNKKFKIQKNLNFLGYKSIIKDIKDLPKFYTWFFLCVGFMTMFLSFFDINHFTDHIHNKSLWTIINTLHTKKSYLGRTPQWIIVVLYSLSGIASFTGVINVFLISFGKMSAFFWGAFNTLFTGLFSFVYGYAGDAQIYLFWYFPCQFFGWYMWNKTNNENNSTIKTRSSNINLVIPISLLVTALLAVIWYYEIPLFNKSITNSDYAYINKSQWIPHSFDAIENGIGISAQILMILKYKEQWILWIIADILTLSMFSGISSIGSKDGGINININMMIQMTFYTINCIIGWLNWSKKLKIEEVRVNNILTKNKTSKIIAEKLK